MILDKERLVRAIKEIFRAYDMTPPDEYIQNISNLANSPEAQAQVEAAVKAIQEQYVNIGNMIKEKIDEAIKLNKKEKSDG
jgi:hypothetical protein